MTPFLRIDFSALNLPYRKLTFLSPPSLRDTSPYHKGEVCKVRLRDTSFVMRENKVGEVDTSLPTIEAGLVVSIFSLTMEA